VTYHEVLPAYTHTNVYVRSTSWCAPRTGWCRAISQPCVALSQAEEHSAFPADCKLTCLIFHPQAMQHGALPPVMHLRNVNPYVESTLGDWGKRQGLAAAVPRQAAPAPTQSPANADCAVGTSSFGMSGVNSHVLLRPTRSAIIPSDEKLQL
jgi:hypothetical protein